MEKPEIIPPGDHGEVASQISREIVRIYAKLYGRGPTKAKTFLANEYALCLLENVFTPAERTLIEAGHGEQVHSTRAAFQDAIETDFTRIVEAATGRNVRAYASQIHTGIDAAFEMFLFEEEVADSPQAE